MPAAATSAIIAALTSVRDYSAVTAACVMMRTSVFDQVSGFDEKFGIGFNDTDLCLRIGAAGYKILYDGYTILLTITNPQPAARPNRCSTRPIPSAWSNAGAPNSPPAIRSTTPTSACARKTTCPAKTPAAAS